MNQIMFHNIPEFLSSCVRNQAHSFKESGVPEEIIFILTSVLRATSLSPVVVYVVRIDLMKLCAIVPVFIV